MKTVKTVVRFLLVMSFATAVTANSQPTAEEKAVLAAPTNAPTAPQPSAPPVAAPAQEVQPAEPSAPQTTPDTAEPPQVSQEVLRQETLGMWKRLAAATANAADAKPAMTLTQHVSAIRDGKPFAPAKAEPPKTEVPKPPVDATQPMPPFKVESVSILLREMEKELNNAKNPADLAAARAGWIRNLQVLQESLAPFTRPKGPPKR
jgi:hypothetical protein